MLDASDNGMFGFEDMSGITAWAASLKANTSITELNLAKNDITADDAKILAPAISGNRAMTKFDISSNNLRAEGGKALAAGLKGNQVITELNISDNNLGLNFEFSFDSNFDADTSGITAIADAIPDMRALTKFDISKNVLKAEGGMALAAGLKGNQVITELNIGSNWLGIDRYNSADTSGAVAIADVISDMRALRCVDGTLYQSKKSFMMSTNVCCHCGQHKTQHTSR
jgi:Ran GTPase-activating protein (RanGAP) involved in mRNA processing and transport